LTYIKRRARRRPKILKLLANIHVLPIALNNKTLREPAARWEHYAHEADMGVRGYGATQSQAFEQAALAMTAVIADPATIEPREQVDVDCQASDEEILLTEWLNCLVYEMATRKMLFSRFAVFLDGTRLSAQAWGEPVDIKRHHPAVEVKGATYTTLRVARQDGGWMAQTVVDV
jgi:SHS2 domain-containing protein